MDRRVCGRARPGGHSADVGRGPVRARVSRGVFRHRVRRGATGDLGSAPAAEAELRAVPASRPGGQPNQPDRRSQAEQEVCIRWSSVDTTISGNSHVARGEMGICGRRAFGPLSLTRVRSGVTPLWSTSRSSLVRSACVNAPQLLRLCDSVFCGRTAAAALKQVADEGGGARHGVEWRTKARADIGARARKVIESSLEQCDRRGLRVACVAGCALRSTGLGRDLQREVRRSRKSSGTGVALHSKKHRHDDG